MSIEENKRLVARWFGDAYAGDVDVADDIFASDFVLNGQHIGAIGQKESLIALRAGFPDVRVEFVDQVVTDDAIVSHNIIRGTHLGTYNDIEATGKEIEIHSTIMWHVVSGKAVRDWTIWDQFSLLQQLGILPGAATNS